MPKEPELYLSMPRLLTRRTMDHLLLGYVLGYRHSSPLPVLQVRAAIEKFIEDFQIQEDEYPFDSMVRNFYKIYEDLADYDHQRVDQCDKMRFKRMQKRSKL